MKTLSDRVLVPVAVILILILITIGGLLGHVNRNGHITHTEGDTMQQSEAESDLVSRAAAAEPVQKAALLTITPKKLLDAIVRYMAAKDFAAKCAIANEVAFSETHLWESCALRSGGVQTIDLNADQALGHFASVYFHRGPKQKEELVSLLQSDDLHVVAGLLKFLNEARELDANGEPQLSKPLGGSELLPFVSRIARVHPKLSMSVIAVLAHYGELARSEIATILWGLLSPDEVASFTAGLSLSVVDDDLFSRFGIEGGGPLTESRREQILEYIRSLDKTPAPARFLRFPIGVPWLGAIVNTWRTQITGDSGASCNSLYGDIVRYRLAKDSVTRSAIANGVASTQTNLLESCVLRVFFVNTIEPNDERDALGHFVSAFFKRGPKQKEELFSLLQSRDEQMVVGLLWLLSSARDLGPNGELQIDKPLGGSEVPPYLSQVARTRPDLAGVAVLTLMEYGPFARSETATLLRVVLSDDQLDSRNAKRALLEVDFDGLYSKFSLDPDKPLTKEQRAEIETYLDLHGGK